MGNFRFIALFGSLNILLKIGIPFVFLNYRAVVTQLSFKKIKFGNLKSYPKRPLIFLSYSQSDLSI